MKIAERPFFAGLLSSVVVDNLFSSCGLSPEKFDFDRDAFEAVGKTVEPYDGRQVLREDLEVPCADGGGTNGARLYTGPMFMKYNAVLRGLPDVALPWLKEKMDDYCKDNR